MIATNGIAVSGITNPAGRVGVTHSVMLVGGGKSDALVSAQKLGNSVLVSNVAANAVVAPQVQRQSSVVGDGYSVLSIAPRVNRMGACVGLATVSSVLYCERYARASIVANPKSDSNLALQRSTNIAIHATAYANSNFSVERRAVVLLRAESRLQGSVVPQVGHNSPLIAQSTSDAVVQAIVARYLPIVLHAESRSDAVFAVQRIAQGALVANSVVVHTMAARKSGQIAVAAQSKSNALLSTSLQYQVPMIGGGIGSGVIAPQRMARVVVVAEARSGDSVEARVDNNVLLIGQAAGVGVVHARRMLQGVLFADAKGDSSMQARVAGNVYLVGNGRSDGRVFIRSAFVPIVVVGQGKSTGAMSVLRTVRTGFAAGGKSDSSLRARNVANRILIAAGKSDISIGTGKQTAVSIVATAHSSAIVQPICFEFDAEALIVRLVVPIEYDAYLIDVSADAYLSVPDETPTAYSIDMSSVGDVLPPDVDFYASVQRTNPF